MFAPRPGWLVVACALVVSVSAWFPWLTTAGGGTVSAIGGAHRVSDPNLPALDGFGVGQLMVLLAAVLAVAGAMTARGLSARGAAGAALVLAAAVSALIVVFYRSNAGPSYAVSFGLYVGAAGAVGAVAFSLWALAAALSSR
ncbi:hypothetical protein LV457_02065 [Mycobacterium sp. MYCO198283]|uniref:hypothetical protein n=1 Tax=Mycobacterium sp. MYCO198283 TaxID=2883505 RepID=UPI001E2D673B|nr:hypothetical protein [Mycobacterium sp. MYCO198283]MCG5431078.1 hypothetical protein [Mycobacterium sp. MYCO198283]